MTRTELFHKDWRSRILRRSEKAEGILVSRGAKGKPTDPIKSPVSSGAALVQPSFQIKQHFC